MGRARPVVRVITITVLPVLPLYDIHCSFGNNFVKKQDFAMEGGLISSPMKTNTSTGQYAEWTKDELAEGMGTGRAYSKSGSSVPMILMPRQSDKECIPSNQLSSIGFVGFILAVINASMNIVNNANSNNNNRNNNNNNDNINIANLNTQQMNMQFVMAGRGLRSRRSVCKERNGAVGSVARVGATYLELWYRLHSISPPCVLYRVCQTAREVSAYSDSHHLVEQLNRLLVAGLSLHLMQDRQIPPDAVVIAGATGRAWQDCATTYPCQIN